MVDKHAFSGCRDGILRLWLLFAVASLLGVDNLMASVAAGAVSGGQGAPIAEVSPATAISQTITYKFTRPAVGVASDGIGDIRMAGLENGGEAGAPSLPELAVRIAIPQGKKVKSVNVVPLKIEAVAEGVTLRHAERQVHPMAGAVFAATPRDKAIYSSNAVYPAAAGGDWHLASKNGIDFCELILTPAYCKPASGEVGYYPEVLVTVEYENPLFKKAASGASGSKVPFVPTAKRRAAVAELVDNPEVVSGYTASRSTFLRGAAASGEDEDGENASAGQEMVDAFKKPALPCSNKETYPHVVITDAALSDAALGLVMYRRMNGVFSTMVTVQDIQAAYSYGLDKAATIREFIRDAYKNWNTEYVVLAGDSNYIPARMLRVAIDKEVANIPSDLYYQCLDGDFDNNGNGIYGEPNDGPDGGMPDIYAEVKIGRVPAETPDEFANWLAKVKKYDGDVVAGAAYTRGALFAAEFLGPYQWCQGQTLMEQIRIGSKYTGGNDGYDAFGFNDVPELFDADRITTLYDTGMEESWNAKALANAIVDGDGVSVINHMGHSNSDYNMRMSNAQVDALVNENPVFVYSQGCIAGAFDTDCIAEHFTTSTEYGAFAGVWNSREGWYSYSEMQVLASGASQRLHRRFWDAVFRDGHRELGYANMLSHERNATYAKTSGHLRWCYYESNLFGDPIQEICGADSRVTLDREAYRSDADMTVQYVSPTAAESFTALITVYRDGEVAGSSTVELPFAGVRDNVCLYEATVALADLDVAHDDEIVVAIEDERAFAASAYIDDVPPAFTDVSLRSADEGLIAASWKTYDPGKSDDTIGAYALEETTGTLYIEKTAPFIDPDMVADEGFASIHALTISGAVAGRYYVRIKAEDKAGNVNVWNSTEPTDEVISADESEYGAVTQSPRVVRAYWDMERDTAGWTTDASTCWQLGNPTYGPRDASRCWGTILDGRHPDGANATLTSPAVVLHGSPAITFRHWHAINKTPKGKGNVDDADYGIVEVMAVPADSAASGGNDGTWVNAAQFAKGGFENGLVSGKSDGWETVRILLPAEYENKSIRVRFRFVSDDYPANRYPADYPMPEAGNPAGWYIDGVQFQDVPSYPDLVLSVLPVDDETPAVVVKAGETTQFRLATFNGGDAAIVAKGAATVTAVSGAIDLAAEAIALEGGSPGTATYGTIEAGASATASETFALTVADNVPVGTTITLSQTIIAADGTACNAVALLRVSDPASISGIVKQPEDGAPVVNAVVTAGSSDAEYTVTTGADGLWRVDGLPPGGSLQVKAAYGETSVEKTVTAPDEDIELILPLAEFGISTDEVTVDAIAGDYADGGEIVIDSVVISNVFVLAALDGNVGPTAGLTYMVSGHMDIDGNEPAWLHIENPEGVVEPNGSVALQIHLYPGEARPGVANTVQLTVLSNGWNERTAELAITLNVWDDIELEAAGTSGTDILTDIPLTEEGEENEYTLAIYLNNDFDGNLEKGEMGFLTLALRNPSPYEEITSFEGTVEAVSGAKVVSDASDPAVLNYEGRNIATWRGIAPESTSECIQPVAVVMKSTEAQFKVSGWAYHGASSNWQEVAFNVALESQTAATGTVVAVNCFPATPVNETNGVYSARLSATDANGKVFYSNYTPPNGRYILSGLTPGTKYWLRTEIPAASVAVAPFAHVITPDEESHVETILCKTYGDNAGHLSLVSVDFDDAETGDGDGFIDNGETIRLYPTFLVDSATSVNNIRAKLSVPDEFERTVCMTVAEGADEIAPETAATWVGRSVYTLGDGESAFEIVVDDTAVEGDYQRFLLEAWEDTGDAEPKHWYYDFALTVQPRHSISGTALAEDGEVLDGITVELADADGNVVDKVDASAEDGTFEFSEVAAGDWTLSLSAIPDGYVAVQDSIAATIDGVDVDGIEFTLKPWGLTPGGDGYEADSDTAGSGAISLTVEEGESTTAEFTLTAAADADNEDLSVVISYYRTPAEILSKEDVEVGTAAARTALADKIGSNWTALDTDSFSNNRFEFVFKDDTTIAERDAYLARRGLVAVHHFKTIPAAIAVPAANAASLASATLSNAPLALTAGDDASILVSAQPAVKGASAQAFVPDDPLYSDQWALSNTRQTGGTLGADIGAEAAWEYAGMTGSHDVIVAVTDTGVNYAHPDLVDNWSGLGWNYVNDTDNCSDGEGHGTHVAGIIGAVGDNGIGIAGVNWNVSIMSQRVSMPLPQGGSTWADSAGIAQSFEDAMLAGASVNNNSWGGPFYSDILYRIMKKAQEYDMLFVCAAGNEAKDLDVVPSYPASMAQWLDNVIVVAASDHNGLISYFSNYGVKNVHLAAPGEDILSLGLSTGNGRESADATMLSDPGNYVEMSGTSMATPYVAGAAAFLKAVAPTATYGYIRDALLSGVRVDTNLVDYVSTSGHLDLEMSTRILGSNWLRFGEDSDDIVVLSTNITLSAGETVSLPLLVNDKPLLRAGTYKAEIEVVGASRLVVPATVTVTPQAIASIASVEVAGEEASDGILAHGEDVTLNIAVRNIGSTRFRDLSAVLCDENGTAIEGAEWVYGYVAGLTTTEPGAFSITLPSTGTDVAYTLKLSDSGTEVASLPVELMLFDGAIVEVDVSDASGSPVAGAEVEFIGACAARAVSDDAGTARLVVPSGVDTATLRVTADGFTRLEKTGVSLSGTVEAVLANATLTPSVESIELSVPVGMSAATNIALAATTSDGNALAATLKLAKRSKIAVFDDRDDSAFLVKSLRDMGFDVSYFPQNYIYAVYDWANKESEIIQAPRYTWDDAALLPYDAIIAIPTGNTGNGRLLAPLEQEAFETYVREGGRLIVSGVTTLASPDNADLADLAGLTDDSCEIVDVVDNAATVLIDNLGAPFVTLNAGDAFAANTGAYDAVTEDAIVDATAIATVESADGTTIAKLYASDVNDNGGQLLVWNGNADEWQRPGASLDILRSYLYGEFYEDNAPAWLVAEGNGESISIANGGETALALNVNSDGSLGEGTYDAVVLLTASTDAGQCLAIPVSLAVMPPEVRVFTSGAVVDAAGRPLRGDGTSTSCIFQLIYAGADGEPDAPGADGSASGDDILLAASESLLHFARFGAGVSSGADTGRFDVLFNLSFEGYSENAETKLYVRAWDGNAVATSVLYGDSQVIEVTYVDGKADPIDFGSWSLDNIVADSIVDANGDGLPDAWTALFRPAVDPQAAVAPLEASATADGIIDTTAVNGSPVRAFATDAFVVALEQFANRIAVYDRYTGEPVNYFGAVANNGIGVNYTKSTDAYILLGNKRVWAQSSTEGGFKQPQGLAFDNFSGETRFAVADTGNNRIQLFTLDDETGEIAFVSAYGTKSPVVGTGADKGTFSTPVALAFARDGSILVADKENHRVAAVKFNASGSWAWNASYAFTENDVLTGICYGEDADYDGFWVANDGAERQCVSFHRTAPFSVEPAAMIGSATDGVFDTPKDVQFWTVGSRTRIVVADCDNSRIRILDPIVDASGNYIGVETIADVGDYSDATIEAEDKVWHPEGVFPIQGENILCVADTGHNQVKFFSVTLDDDGDGMDDFWEDKNGLDSTSADDANEDADGDGLSNIGEFLSGCDPQSTDSDGDGRGDFFEMLNGSEPLDKEEIPDVTPVEFASLTADPVEVEQGTAVTITATFSGNADGASEYDIYDATGVLRASGSLEFSADGLSATIVVDTSAFEPGAAKVTLTVAACDPPVRTEDALFTVASGDEETEIVPWTIDSFTVDAGGAPVATIGWTVPAEDLPSNGGDLLFRIDFRTSLAEGDWDKTMELVAVPQSKAGEITTTDIDVSTYPGSGFFCLWWINKVK